MDAVAASLLDEPPKDDDTDEDLGQAEADADDQTEVEDDADGSDADDDGEEDDEGDDESEAEDDEDDSAERLYTVKVNGREQQVPLAELLRGYSGQAYIQEGMKKVAEAKNEVEAVYTALQSERQQLAQFVQAVQTGQVPMQPPKAPDEAMLQTDPIGYLEARVKYDKEVAAYQQAQMAMQQMTAKQAEAEERARMAYLADQHRQLAQIIPAFAKPETAAKVKQDLVSTGMEIYGYSQDELRAITDHRALRVLHDAAQYQRLMKGKTVAEKRAEQPKTPTLKPGVKASPQMGKKVKVEKAKAQMKRSGSVDDVTRFLLT